MIHKFSLRKTAAAVLAVTLSVGFFLPSFVSAATFTNISDTMSTQAPSTAADHAMAWTLASGHTTAVNAVITIDFNQTDFITSGTWQTTDFAFSDNVRSSAAPAAVGTGATTCSGSSASNYIVNVTAATSTFVIKTCTGWTTSAATTPTTFVIKGATGGTGVLTNQTNVDSSLYTITDTINDTDSGQGAIVIETNDVVTVTATVNPTLTFSLSSGSIAFGTLATGSAHSGTHTITVATNAPGGFGVTYNGTQLSNGAYPLSEYLGAASVPGTEGWGLNLVSNTVPSVGAAITTNSGFCNPGSGYDTTNVFSYSSGSPITLASSVGAPADCVFTASYVANINTTTPAGAYSGTLTYIATGTF